MSEADLRIHVLEMDLKIWSGRDREMTEKAGREPSTLPREVRGKPRKMELRWRRHFSPR